MPTFTESSLIAAGTGALLWAVLAAKARARWRTWIGLPGCLAISAAVFCRYTNIVVFGCAAGRGHSLAAAGHQAAHLRSARPPFCLCRNDGRSRDRSCRTERREPRRSSTRPGRRGPGCRHPAVCHLLGAPRAPAPATPEKPADRRRHSPRRLPRTATATARSFCATRYSRRPPAPGAGSRATEASWARPAQVVTARPRRSVTPPFTMSTPTTAGASLDTWHLPVLDPQITSLCARRRPNLPRS
jgi:hypothetical protein